VDSNMRKPSFSRLYQLAVLLAWIVAFWCLFQHMSGSPLLGKFLHPDYWWLVEVGTAILIVFVISLVYCDPHDRGRRGVGLVLQMGIMILPLLYLPMAFVAQIGPDAAKKRSFYMTQPGAILAAPVSKGSSEKLPENPSLLRLALDAEFYEGKNVTTMGRAYWDSELPQDSFFCYRLLMFCCAADARPIGVLVEYDKQKTFEKGSWVKVQGTVGFTTFRGRRLTKIRAEKVSPTEPPKVPYLFP
jgi:putative membrane protein